MPLIGQMLSTVKIVGLHCVHYVAKVILGAALRCQVVEVTGVLSHLWRETRRRETKELVQFFEQGFGDCT